MPGSIQNLFTACFGGEAIVFRNLGVAELTVTALWPGVHREKGHPSKGMEVFGH